MSRLIYYDYVSCDMLRVVDVSLPYLRSWSSLVFFRDNLFHILLHLSVYLNIISNSTHSVDIPLMRSCEKNAINNF